MAEYIEREKVKEALLGWDYDPSDDDVECAINHIPTADVVEVVRCKDCKHSTLMYGTYVCDNTQSPWFNDVFDIDMEANDYCSYGKKKEGAEE